MKKTKKVLSMLLVLVMLLSLLPVNALAAENAEEAPEDAAAAEEILTPEEPAEEAEPTGELPGEARPSPTDSGSEPEPTEEPAPTDPETPEEPTDPAEEEDELEVESLPEEEEEDDEPELELASVVDSGTCGDFVNWSLSEEGILTITGKGSMALYNAATEVPWYAHVAEIKAACIGEGVTTIAMNAFNGCAAMTEVSIPPTVKTIGSSAFKDCSGLTELILPAGISRLTVSVFNGCSSLVHITIPAGVTSISNTAFANCTLLEEIVFEGPAPSFGSNVFAGVTATAYYPGDDPTWSEDVRQNYGGTITWVAVMPVVVDTGDCGDGVTWVLTDDGVLTISGSGPMWDFSAVDPTYYDLREDITSVVIQDGVTSVSKYAFYMFVNLESVTIPDSVTSIGNYAFTNCYSLTNLTIPASVTSIGNNPVTGCSSLTDLTVDPTNEYYTAVDGVLFSKDMKTLIACLNTKGSYVIPDGCTTIGACAFRGCDALMSVTAPDSVTSIGENAFASCNLASMIIPDSCTFVGSGAFYFCTSLTSVMIGNSVTSIGRDAFYYCTALKTIIFLGNAPSFGGANVFYQVTATAYYPEDDVSWTEDVRQNYGGTIDWKTGVISGTCGDDVYWMLSANGVLTISGTGPMDTSWDRWTTPWAEHASEICAVVIKNGVTTIGNCAFDSCAMLASVTLPDSLISIKTSAFSDCTALTSIIIPASVTDIGCAFMGCTALKEIDFEGNAPSFGDSDLFSGVTATANYPSGDATWTSDKLQNYGGMITWKAYDGFCGDHVFWRLEGSVLSIFGTGAMKIYNSESAVPWLGERNSITSAVIENGVTSIGQYAFYDCAVLADISIPVGVTHISYDAFYGCSALTSVTIPDSVGTIGGEAFRYCTSLTSASLPDGLTSIGNAAFSSCMSLTSVTIPDSVGTIGREAFRYCTSLTSASLPNDLTSIEPGLFYGCRELVSVTIPDSVTSIGSYAFDETALTSLAIPAGVTSMGYNPVMGCGSLTDLTVDPANEYYTAVDNVIFSKDMETLIACPDTKTVYMVPDGCTVIEAYAFQECRKLNSIRIPDSVTDIGSHAFYSCEALQKTVFEGSAPSIGGYAFFVVTTTAYYPAGDATWTEDVRQNYGGTITWKPFNGSCGDDVYWALEDGRLTIFGTGAMMDFSSGDAPWYSDRDSITSVIIESGVTAIGTNAFSDCTALTEIFFQDSAPSIGTDAFSGVTASGYYPADNATWTAHKLQGYGGTITWRAVNGTCGDHVYWRLEDGMLTIFGTGAMTDFDSRVSVPWYSERDSIVSGVIESGVTSIGDWAFNGCTALTSITIPNSVTNIGFGAFENCCSLTNVTIPDNCIAIGGFAFFGCTALTNMTIPASVISIGNRAFVRTGLKEIIFEGSAPAFEEYVFFGITTTAYYPAGDPTWTEDVRQNYGGMITWVALNGSVTPGSVTLDQSYVVIASGAVDPVRLYLTMTPESWQGLLETGAEDENGDPSTLITVTLGTEAETGKLYIDVLPAPASGKGTAYAVAFVPTGDRTLTARCRVDVVQNPAAHPIAADVDTVVNGVSGVRLTEAAATVELYRTDYTRIEVIPELTENNVTVSALGPTDEVVVPEAQENGGAAVTAAEFTDGETAKRFSLRVADDRTLEVVPTADALNSVLTMGSSYTSAIKVTVDGQAFTTPTKLKISVKKSLPNIKAKAVVLNSYESGKDTQPVVFTGGTVAPGKAVVDTATKPEWLSYDATAGAVTYTGAAGAAQKKTNLLLQVQPEGWAVRRSVAVAVSAKSTAPTVTFQTKSLTLKPATNDRAATAYTVKPALFADAEAAFVRITEGSGKTAVTYENGSVLNVSVGSGEVRVTAPYVDGKAHTYTVTLSVLGKEASFTVKTLAENKAVTLSLGVKGNIDLAVEKSPAVITAKATNIHADCAAFSVKKIVKKGDTAETNMKDAFGIAVKGNVITVTANGVSETGTYIATVQADCGGGVKAEKTANITVKKSSTTPKVSVKLKAAGSIDVLRLSMSANGNFITLTPTVTNDYTYTLNAADIAVTKTYDGATKQKVNENARAKFTVIVQDGKYVIAAKNGAGVSHADKYSVTATIDGVTSGAVALKVVQGKCKVTQDVKQVTLLHSDRYSRGVVTLTLSDPALKGIGDVKIVSSADKSKRAYFDLVDLGGGKYAVVYNESLLPANVRALKAQTVKLQVLLTGNMTEKPNATISVKVNIK